MLIRFRSWLDKMLFGARAEWPLLLAIASFTVGLVVGLAPGLPGISLWLVLAIGVFTTISGLVLLIVDVRSRDHRYTSWTMVRDTEPHSTFPAKLSDPDLPTVVLSGRGLSLIDPELDAKLPTASVPLYWSRRRFRLPAELWDRRAYFFNTATAGTRPFNGRKVGLLTPMSLRTVGSGSGVKVHPGRHFDSVCADELAAWTLRDELGPWDFRSRYVYDPKTQLRPFDANKLLNGVGVSTLAITTDDQLIVILQSLNAANSPGTWAPSGSGALEPKDRRAANGDFLRMVIAGAERELREEAGLRENAIDKSIVIGYSRWVNRGAKAEFYCVTRLAVHSNEVRTGARVHPCGSYEREWTKEVCLVPLNLNGLKAITEGAARRSTGWRSSGVIPDSRTIDSAVSVPLEMALDAFVRARVARRLDAMFDRYVAT